MSDPLGLLDIARTVIQTRLRVVWTAVGAIVYALGVWLPLVDDVLRVTGQPILPAPLTTPLGTLTQIAQWAGLPVGPLNDGSAWIAARDDLIGNLALFLFCLALLVSALDHATIEHGPLAGTFGLSAATAVQTGSSPLSILGIIALAIAAAGVLPGQRQRRMANVFALAVLPLLVPAALVHLLLVPGANPKANADVS